MELYHRCHLIKIPTKENFGLGKVDTLSEESTLVGSETISEGITTSRKMQISEDLGADWTACNRRSKYSPVSPDKTSCQPMWLCCASPLWKAVAVIVLLVAIRLVTLLNALGPQRWKSRTDPSSWKEELNRPAAGPVDLPITAMTVRVYPSYRNESPELYPWVHVAEPYRMAVMEVNTSRPSEVLSNNGVDFR